MEQLKDYYAYVYTNQNNEIMYIGRGCGNRTDFHSSKHHHNPELHIAILEQNLALSFVAINQSEESSIAIESILIEHHDPIFNKLKGTAAVDYFKAGTNFNGSRRNRGALSDMKTRPVSTFWKSKNEMGQQQWNELCHYLYNRHVVESWTDFNIIMASELNIKYDPPKDVAYYGRKLTDTERGLMQNRLKRVREYASKNNRVDLENLLENFILNVGIDKYINMKMSDIWQGIGEMDDFSNKGRNHGQYKGDIHAAGKVFTSASDAEKHWNLGCGTAMQRIKNTKFPYWYFVNWCGRGMDPSNSVVTADSVTNAKRAAQAAKINNRWWKRNGTCVERLKIWKNIEEIRNAWLIIDQQHTRGCGCDRFQKEILFKMGFKYKSKKFSEKMVNLFRSHRNKEVYENGMTEYQRMLEEQRATDFDLLMIKK